MTFSFLFLRCYRFILTGKFLSSSLALESKYIKSNREAESKAIFDIISDRKAITFLESGAMGEAQSFGGWLRHRRRELDLTQEELARQIGCARITLRKIEADQMRPSRQLAELLREYLGVPIEEQESFIRFSRGGEQTAPVAVTAQKHNLPHPVSSFIGRERQIAEVKHLVESSQLVTLTGAGGSGKTRLALQVAGQMLDQFPEGVWFVGFAPLSESTLVQQTIASVLRVREEASRPLLETLADYLHPRKLLLLFDNCEHLIAECAQTAESLLQDCPQLHILVTSREALGILGEEQYYVPTLSLPEARETASLEKLMRSEAVRLFIERAKAINPDFALTGQNAGAVVQVCQHLDGIPLALELAAALAKGLSVEQIADHLDDRFHLLTAGSRTALPRQRTLQATIDWSYKLLSEAERVALQRLSVFAGSWTLNAAEFVCAGDGLGSNQILDLQLHLIDKSLVVAETEGNEPRYHMLETIRQYAQEKLEESGGTRQVRARHLEFFLAWGEQAELGFRSREFRLWLDRMDKERDNLRAALGYAIDSGQSESALRLFGATFWVWFIRGPWSEGQRWAEAILAEASDEPAALRARALMALGLLLTAQSDYLEAHKLLEQSVDIWRKLDDKWWLAFAITILGYCFLRESQPAHDLLREGLRLAREVDDKWLLALCLHLLSENELYQGNLTDARTMAEESLGLIRDLGDHMIRSVVLNILGEVADAEQDYPRALHWYEEGLAVAREIGDMDEVTNLEFNMGRVLQVSGNNDQAAHLFTETLQESVRSGKKSTLIGALAGLGIVAQARGDSRRAVRLLQASESLFDDLSRRIFIDPMERAWSERHLAAARAQLGEESFLAMRKEGREMTLEQVIQYALEGAKEK
jgi:predicted ATPase/DNA-binding XRE family transcriptional regulator